MDVKASKFTVTTGPLPYSKKVYVPGPQGVAVPMREIEVKGPGEQPLAVYDTSGPYTDPQAKIDIEAGLPALRSAWIEARGDTELYEGREVKAEDNGYREGQEAAVRVFPNTTRMK